MSFYSTPSYYFPYQTNTRTGTLQAYSQGALSDFDGVGNTQKIIAVATGTNDTTFQNTVAGANSGYYVAAQCCYRFYTTGTSVGDWYLPAEGELAYMPSEIKDLDATLSALRTKYGTDVCVSDYDGLLWSSTSDSGRYAYTISNYSSYKIGGIGRHTKNGYIIPAFAFYRFNGTKGSGEIAQA